MKYVINIAPADPANYCFIGTPFFGEEFSSIADLRKIWDKYDLNNRGLVELSFSSAETIVEIKERANEMAKKGENINIFSLGVLLRKDPYHEISIYYGGKKVHDENGEFWFILERKSGGELLPQYGKKLHTILEDMGMVLG